jgi:cytochrome c oxidase cbb3-type subunit 3
MQQVSSFILSLKGTSPATPKAPQGELYSITPAPAEATPVIDSTAVVATIE